MRSVRRSECSTSSLRSTLVLVTSCVSIACVQEIPAPAVDAAVVDTIPDAAVAPTPQDAADTPPAMCQQQVLLRNGTFDAVPGSAGWTVTSNVANDPIVTSLEGVDAPPAHSSPNRAYFGGLDNLDETLHQDVAIPAGTVQLILSGYYQIRTIETASDDVDQAWIELGNTGRSNSNDVLCRWSHKDATAGWVPFSVSVREPPANQTVRLRIHAGTDHRRWTTFLFDTLSLTAIVCP
jgi:hypothetical protein